MMSSSVAVVALVLFTKLVYSQNLSLPGDELNFYWREYYGVIPRDAIIGGENSKKDPTYIGSAVAAISHDSYGVFPGSIVEGQKYIEIAVGDQIQKSELFVKILCSDTPDKFHWSKTSAWDFNKEFSLERNPVRGGLQHDMRRYQYLYIGRYQNGYENVIGKIPYESEDTENPLFYPSAEKQLKTDDYEVLILTV